MDNVAQNTMDSVGLVLTGGGARGAYQAGALLGIAEIIHQSHERLPYRVLSGSSAGAINCAFLACGSDYYLQVAKSLCELWENIVFSDIYKTDMGSLGHLGFRWAKGLTFAGLGTSSAPNYLLDTAPLKRLIEDNIDFSQLPRFESQGGTLAINTTHYQTGAAITFFSDEDEKEIWKRNQRLSIRTKLEPVHVLASSAIPVLFPPVKIGSTYYGDGALRMKAPFSPAIHLGATKILAIGVKRMKATEDIISEMNASVDHISLSDIAGVLLNSVFLDSLDSDLERLERINATLSNYNSAESKATALKTIDVLAIRPSQDLGEMAKPTLEYFPKTLRHLLSGAGANSKRGSDLLSYLSFHPTYTKKLIELGRQDALAQSDQVRQFFD